MKIPFLAALVFVSLATGNAAPPSAGLPTQPLKIAEAALPGPPFQTSGGFLVTFGGTLVASGTAGDAQRLWVLEDSSGQWSDSGIEVPAYAAVARWGEKWIVAGGLRDGSPVGNVSVLSWEEGGLKSRELPDLPQPRAGSGAAVILNRLHVFAGAASLEPFQPTGDLFLLDLAAPAPAWQAGPPFPGSPRAF